MRLSWNEIRARAATFAREWADAHYERGETQSFYNDFFEVFGVKRRLVATFEEPVKKLGDKQGFIDLFWKGKLLVEHKSTGRDLARARTQALDYFPGLKDHELPRYILVCDFQTFHLIDLDTRDETRFALADLPAHVEAFGFVVGIEKRVFKDQDPVNIIAAELMGKLHDALKASGYDGHPLERLLVRLLFCLFADDTGIFDELGLLETYIVDRTAEDGSDLGPKLIHLFQVLNTPTDKRQKSLDEDLNRFPYINGDLFAEVLPIPDFNKDMRDRLLEACGFSWQKISPAIFGALFQSVMNAREASSTTPSPGPLSPTPTRLGSTPSPRRSSTPAPPIPTRRWPISTTPTSCPPICARRTARSTWRWTASIARRRSTATASGSSTCSCSTKR